MSTRLAIENDGPQGPLAFLYRIRYFHPAVAAIRWYYLTLTVTGRRPGGLGIATGGTAMSVSSSESWIDDTGLREEVAVAAIKAVFARQLAEEMEKKKLSKRRMAELMKTSRTQVGRLLDAQSGNVTIESLQRAARIVGRELRMELV
jgi:antitoxin HicB